MRSLQNTIVFPDEIVIFRNICYKTLWVVRGVNIQNSMAYAGDSEEERSRNKKLNREERKDTHAEEKEDLRYNWREPVLATWKSGSIFRSCKKLSCDSLYFFSETSICYNCRKIRAKLFSRICITFPKKTLSNVVLDYLYFHSILIFDKEAEIRFSTESPNNPYFINYRKIKSFNATLVHAVADMFQFSDNMKAAVEQHSEMALVSQKNIGLEHFCEVCGIIPNVSTHWIMLKNRRYRLANFKMISRKKGEDEEHIVRLCPTHADVFKVYFYMYHMDWIVHWNCYHWVQAVMGKSTKTLSSEEIIDEIDPNNYKYLTTHLAGFYKKLDGYAATGKNQMFLAAKWRKLVIRWKCGVVRQSYEAK